MIYWAVYIGTALAFAGIVYVATRPKKPVTTDWEFFTRTNLFDLGVTTGGFVDTLTRYQDGTKLIKREWYDDDGRLSYVEGPAEWLPSIESGLQRGGKGPSDADRKAKGVV